MHIIQAASESRNNPIHKCTHTQTSSRKEVSWTQSDHLCLLVCWTRRWCVTDNVYEGVGVSMGYGSLIIMPYLLACIHTYVSINVENPFHACHYTNMCACEAWHISQNHMALHTDPVVKISIVLVRCKHHFETLIVVVVDQWTCHNHNGRSCMLCALKHSKATPAFADAKVCLGNIFVWTSASLVHHWRN